MLRFKEILFSKIFNLNTRVPPCVEFWTHFWKIWSIKYYNFGTKSCACLSLLRSCKNYFKIFDILGVTGILSKKLPIFRPFYTFAKHRRPRWCSNESCYTVNFHYSQLEATFGTKFIKIRDKKFCANSWRLLHKVKLFGPRKTCLIPLWTRHKPGTTMKVIMLCCWKILQPIKDVPHHAKQLCLLVNTHL